uniref:protein-disulfide reductase n=1 Tax=Odontella aurita TaxID=265563 RepID=A0A7S4K6K6_9STRA|mmetsp:Transcript_62918/g.185829  ORF Transcript_62918/g.185829 Transcript_62918/m.185829 type:complete len:350 (+) Transcript_62918:200-1249(+)|eukprot:CAMPEP_0113554268 /NCGR_PEP_ID=MMETSP0015_2-20120614/16057_1 /TAXON_ID=2838 /ORGANISM="Odontella" /LENGTH=349 /DNA_ID=CAMNT_0000455395 /DNA_START=80 /DNA_END=1129 /DNA_ORIENTATION=- /assembly_acc=CAM_ASM_000160
MTKRIVLLDATDDSLTVSWPSVAGADRYVLQYRRESDSEEGGDYETLSENLKSTQARKRNLPPESAFSFRARSSSGADGEWIGHEESFRLLTAAEQALRMEAPTATADGNQAAVVRWKAPTGGAEAGTSVDGYELQMRENDGGRGWCTVAPRLGGIEVRKKNLISRLGYQFRVRPVNPSDGRNAFSPPSDPLVGRTLSEGMRRLFSDLEDGALLRGGTTTNIPLDDALAGKEFVLFYASAHWCGPCRQFTPQLTNWYKSVKRQPAGTGVDVVFLSADHDEGSFKSYYSTMPWLAVPYDSDAREGLMAHIRVQGIPRLCVLDGRTGRIIEDNAVGKSLDINRWRQLASGK